LPSSPRTHDVALVRVGAQVHEPFQPQFVLHLALGLQLHRPCRRHDRDQSTVVRQLGHVPEVDPAAGVLGRFLGLVVAQRQLTLRAVHLFHLKPPLHVARQQFRAARAFLLQQPTFQRLDVLHVNVRVVRGIVAATDVRTAPAATAAGSCGGILRHDADVRRCKRPRRYRPATGRI